MASRVQQDAFMDDSDDSCPLCVEEFDLSDKNFKPCPCGYQVCQFCYNNIKNNMNGLCPACRRPYEEKNIEWKMISPEEQKADIALQARKKALARQKENERKNVETLNRKHLAGLRVVQKNLVYVVGLNPKSREDDLLQTLRGDQYFGQYGKIVKIVVSKAKEDASGNRSIGVYVTFVRKQDAASCIAAVDGSQNGDRILRAQYGTTKYCSAYLRNETCKNTNCMFLHEQGEDHDSFSRQDLSSINAVSTQRPAPSAATGLSSMKQNQQPPQPQPPSQQSPQVVTAASQSMVRQGSRDEPMSRSDSGDGSALPSSASWATKPAQPESGRSSNTASISDPSPKVSSSIPAQSLSTQEASPSARENDLPLTTPTTSQQPMTEPHPLDEIVKIVKESSFKFTFDRSVFSQEELRAIDAYPPLFDPNGGLVRYRMEKEREQERLRQQEEERKALGSITTAEEEENPASGSLQLGGEPETEEGHHTTGGRQSSEPRGAIQPPLSAISGNLPFSSTSIFGNNGALNGRSLTPQQQQQLLLLRSGSDHHSPVNNQPQQGYSGQISQHHHQQSNPFQNQSQSFGIPAQGRQASRFTFANNTSSASTAVKPTTDAQLMAQQSSMMPSNHTKSFHSQSMQQPNLHSTHFYSGVQGPPPGLKSSGTPPISGGGMFGQGHGFTNTMGGSSGINTGIGAAKNSNEELMRELLRGRGGNINSGGPDIGKREFKFPPFQNPTTSNAPASALLSSLYGSQLGTFNGYQEHNLQKQKKKGKKHRHANTSSSGGGGIVDLADPSILQARMHHGGAGQGQYGLQGQEFQAIPRHEGTLPFSLNRQDHVQDLSRPQPPSGPRPRKSTPTPVPIPPGLSMPQDFPPLAAPQPASTSSKPQRKPPTTPSSIKPAVPSLQTQPTKGIDNEKQKRVEEQQLSSDKQPVGPVSDAPVEPVSKSKNNKELTAPSSTSQGRSKRQQKSNEISDATASTGLSALSTESGTVETEASTKMQALDSRQRPSKLDITAAKDVSGAVDTATSSKKAADSKDPVSSSTKTTSAISQPETPATASSQASNATTAKQGQPRTLRVVPTSSSETQAKGHGPAPMTSKQPSRRESLSSINLPSTPVSERISDNISLTSASMSRANSPPPNKVGTAPVRHMSKTQQKKERQVRAKQAEEAAKAEAPPIQESVEEPVQAPIIGRKKKTKKAATRGPTADSTPSATRPSSPAAKEDTATLDQEVSLPVTPVQETKRADLPASVEKDSEAPFSPATPASVDQHSSQHQKPAVTASAIWAILRSSKHISPAAADIFRSVPGVNHRFDLDASFLESELQLPDLAPPQLSDEHLDSLERGEAVCVEQPILPNTNSSPDRRLLVVLPDRRTLRGLTKEQAKRYVQLRKEALATSELLHQAGHGPATSKPSPLLPRTASGGTRKGAQGPHLSNPFLVSETSSAAAAAAGSAAAQQGAVNSGSGAVVNPLTKLPQAFGGVLASNVSTTYQDEGAMAAAASTLTAARKGAVGIEEAEVALGASRKETEALEKKLLGLLRRNRRLVFGPNA